MIRILGSLEIRQNDDWQPLTAAKPRQLLAALICRSGSAVSVERLLDEVWGEHPPATARQLLHGYVATLRRMLGDTNDVALVTTPSGYELVVGPGGLDSLRFLDLVATGGRLLREEQFEHASATFADAIACWRGDGALAGVAATLAVMAERDRLEAALLAAHEGRVEAELGCRRHREILPALDRLVREHPLREEFRRQQMLALYRSGRQADALAAYQDLRRKLVEALGIEPGTPVQQLHREILDGTGSQPAHATPWQLPPDLLYFTGRADELALLSARLTNSGPAPVVAISGPGGIGKSALAIHAAHIVARAFPDGVLYVDLHGATPGLSPLEPQAVLARFLRALGLSAEQIPDNRDEAIAVFRSKLAGRRLLVVLDNAIAADQVRSLVPATGESAAIITCREFPAALDSATHLPLSGLSEQDAIGQLTALVGADRVTREREAAAELVGLCGHLPLAIRIAGARLARRAGWTLRTMVDRLTDERHRLDELASENLAVRSSFDVSYRSLADSLDARDLAAARLFRLLGLLDGGDLSLPLAVVLDGRTPTEVDRSIQRLVDGQLLSSTAPGRYALHDLLRLFARELAEQFEDSTDRVAARTRVARWYVATARLAGQLAAPADPRCAGDTTGAHSLSDGRQGQQWLEAERPNLLAVARGAAGEPEFAWVTIELATILRNLLDINGLWDDMAELADWSWTAARAVGDRSAEARALNDRGGASIRRRRYDEAAGQLHQALAIRTALRDESGQAATVGNLGLVYRHLGRFDKAIGYLEDALELRRQLGDETGVVRTLDNLGLVLGDAAQPSRRITCHESALSLVRQLGDRRLEGLVLSNLADAYRADGSHARALSTAREGLRICREQRHRGGEAEALRALGTTHLALGDRSKADEYLLAALRIDQKLDDPQRPGETLPRAGSSDAAARLQ